MLFRRETLEAIAAGTVDLAFRRWDRPRVRAGSRLRTAAGELEVDAVEQVDPDRITEQEARRAGSQSRESLLAELAHRGDRPTYRVALHHAGPDRRAILRQRADLTADEVEELRRSLARLDGASRHGPWTTGVLELVEQRPATRAAELAAALGRETPSFKRDVRKLKELGLTESLEIGYRLSPRGRAYLAARRSR